MEEYLKDLEGGERLARILDLYKAGKIELADAVDIIKHDEQFIVYKNPFEVRISPNDYKWDTPSGTGITYTTTTPSSFTTYNYTTS